jgi:hypothetical protein
MSGLYRHRFKLLLGSLVALILIVPVAIDLLPRGPSLTTSAAVFAVTTVTILAGMLVVIGRRRARVIAFCLLAPSVTAHALSLFLWPREFSVFHRLLLLSLLVFVSWELLRHLFQPGPVTFDTLSASFCVYLIMGVCWAQVYAVLQHLIPGSLVATTPAADVAGSGGELAPFIQALYFSFATLTGVGYGDVVPGTTTARMCAVTEAMMGQAFLYVMVGRLVGMQVSQSFAAQAPATPQPPGQSGPRD